jgi:hypothetical protein
LGLFASWSRQPPVANKNPLAMIVAAAMKNAVSSRVISQSLRIDATSLA